MGNILKSDNSFGQIKIETSKTCYKSGEQLNAIININLKKDFPSKTIYLVLTGEEKILITNPKNTIPLETRENQLIYEHTFPIYESEENFIKKGQYKFPISFILFGSLPGSLEYEFFRDLKMNFGKISYNLWAGFLDEKSNRRFYDKKVIKINQYFDDSDFLKEKVFGSGFIGCCDADLGSYKVFLKMDKVIYEIGDEVVLDVKFDLGKSKVFVTNVDFMVVQKIGLNTLNGKKKNFNRIVLCESKNLFEKNEGGVQDLNFVAKLPILCGVREASTMGVLVQNEFFVLVRIKNSSVFSPVIEHSFKIRVNYKQKESENKKLRFKDWDPVIRPHYTCTISQQYKMTQEFRKTVLSQIEIEE